VLAAICFYTALRIFTLVVCLESLVEHVSRSDVPSSLTALEEAWAENPDYVAVLDALEPLALGAFSHRFSTIHVPKEHEHLLRVLGEAPPGYQLDLLRRYVEYLAWSPKYLARASEGAVSGAERVTDPAGSFIEAAENGMAIKALYYIGVLAESSLREATRLLLRIGCVDVSQVIGHHFSCTESVVRLANRAGLPRARDHLFLGTLFQMQSSPLSLGEASSPSTGVDEILSKLIRKSGFAEYHYMILANGLLNQRGFLGDDYFLHAFSGLERLLPGLRDSALEGDLSRATGAVRGASVEGLKDRIWSADKAAALGALHGYLRENGVTEELKMEILHSYTPIDHHPHDPHYVTVPVSIFELLGRLAPGDVELALAHTVEFAVDRISRNGIAGLRHGAGA
jgi:hypothetical protein